MKKILLVLVMLVILGGSVAWYVGRTSAVKRENLIRFLDVVRRLQNATVGKCLASACQ